MYMKVPYECLERSICYSEAHILHPQKRGNFLYGDITLNFHSREECH